MSDSTTSYPFVHLHPGKEKSLLRGHPWVFSGAIQRLEVDHAAPAPGDWVCVMSSKGQALGWGLGVPDRLRCGASLRGH